MKGQRTYAAASLAQEGFIHMSAGLDQLLWVANRLYADVPESPVILCLDRRRITAEVRDEPARSYPAAPFPHVYGPLNLDAVMEVRRLARDGSGRWVGWSGVPA